MLYRCTHARIFLYLSATRLRMLPHETPKKWKTRLAPLGWGFLMALKYSPTYRSRSLRYPDVYLWRILFFPRRTWAEYLKTSSKFHSTNHWKRSSVFCVSNALMSLWSAFSAMAKCNVHRGEHARTRLYFPSLKKLFTTCSHKWMLHGSTRLMNVGGGAFFGHEVLWCAGAIIRLQESRNLSQRVVLCYACKNVSSVLILLY